MKCILKLIPVCALLLVARGAKAEVNVKVDMAQTWIGWMNVSELPANGGGYLWGSAWGTKDLAAAFTTSPMQLTLGPNTNLFASDPPPNPYWWRDDGTGHFIGNKQMDANFYVEDSSALLGQKVTFSGTVISNTLRDPYTCVAFIKEFNASYALINMQTAALYPGDFTVTLDATTGVHIQYGFETIGPNARGDENPSLGTVVVAAVNTTPAYTLAEATLALKVWAGLETAQAADVKRLHTGTGGIDIVDVSRILRKVAGTDTNP